MHETNVFHRMKIIENEITYKKIISVKSSKRFHASCCLNISNYVTTLFLNAIIHLRKGKIEIYIFLFCMA